jgi:hypothetical protein
MVIIRPPAKVFCKVLETKTEPESVECRTLNVQDMCAGEHCLPFTILIIESFDCLSIYVIRSSNSHAAL